MTRSSTWTKGLLIGAFALAGIGSALAAPYSAVYVFGDSLSDTGNVRIATGLAQPQIGSNTPLPAGQVGYATGRWVDNQGAGVWVDTFAPALGGASVASLAGGTNYAWAGARTGTNSSATGAWYLDQQVNSYLTRAGGGGTASSTALYAILIGGNDIAAIIESASANPATAAATIGAGVTAGLGSIQSQVTSLYAAGARNFLLFNAPDVLTSPRFQQVLGGLDAAGQAGLTFVANSTLTAWNTNFANMVAGLRGGLTGEDIDSFDLAGFGASLGANLTGNGYDGSTAACYIAGPPTTICSTPATRFFWDPFHLNSRVHSQLAAAAIAAVPLPGVLGLVGLGLGMLLMVRRKA
jgi:phospholipase/lecithinase/hemolysin